MDSKTAKGSCSEPTATAGQHSYPPISQAATLASGYGNELHRPGSVEDEGDFGPVAGGGGVGHGWWRCVGDPVSPVAPYFTDCLGRQVS